MAGKLGDHPGFQAVQAHIAAAGNMPMDQAGAVLAASSRNASPAAKKANPRLKRVGGKRSANAAAPPNSYMFDGDKDGM